jgi:hypothetical protein
MKVLGLEWNLESDTLSYRSAKMLCHSLHATKREILKYIASIFDPLGLISPVILDAKYFLQELWNKHLEWDDALSDDDQKKWISIEKQLMNVEHVCIPRSISANCSKLVEYRIVCFCDASQKAYAVAVYLHQRSEDTTKVDLIFSKTRLAPLKKLSITRLELLALVIGLRCLQFVKSHLHLPILDSSIWTDSQCVLHWLHTKKQLSVFVKNRVNEIKKISENVTISYVPSKDNPADIASRGTLCQNLMNNKLWWEGPAWLKNEPGEWPQFKVPHNSKEDNSYESEIRKLKKPSEISLVQPSRGTNTIENTSSDENTGPLTINSQRFSSLTKLLRVTALVLRFVRKLQKKNTTRYITCDEIKESENMWIRHIQRLYYKDVFDAISCGKQNNIQQQLGIYIDTYGILRCKGRLENADISESARCPILLPKYDWYTRLIVAKTHTEILHSGVSQTLSVVRNRFWIPHGRAIVKSVLKSCMICRRFEGGPYKMPPFCSYPKSRVTEGIPFSRIGIDYMGPLYSKTNKDSEKKVWICLFTCLMTRAIHLEIVCDMTTAEFLMCFRRFVAQRGSPTLIISDNALQFRTADKILDHLWNKIPKNAEIMSYVSNAGIKWMFNVELSPWMGGFYERLVALVKRSLKKAIGRKMLSIVQLQTLIKEIEAVINSRPLVYVGDDLHSNIPITPAHFLSNNPKIGIPELEIDSDDDYIPIESTKDNLLKLWKKGQRLLDIFWKTWKDEYLLSLRERYQNTFKNHPGQMQFKPKIGDIVLVKDDTSRGNWKFGKITQLIKSRDDECRSAKVLISSGNELGRPLNLLYPLEVSGEEQQSELKDETSERCKNTIVSRCQRQAAIKAKCKIKQLLSDNNK